MSQVITTQTTSVRLYTVASSRLIAPPGLPRNQSIQYPPEGGVVWQHFPIHRSDEVPDHSSRWSASCPGVARYALRRRSVSMTGARGAVSWYVTRPPEGVSARE